VTIGISFFISDAGHHLLGNWYTDYTAKWEIFNALENGFSENSHDFFACEMGIALFTENYPQMRGGTAATLKEPRTNLQ